jgi:hypothetical protein
MSVKIRLEVKRVSIRTWTDGVGRDRMLTRRSVCHHLGKSSLHCEQLHLQLRIYFQVGLHRHYERQGLV